MQKNVLINLSELPKTLPEEDEFFINERLIPELYNFVMDDEISHATLALKGAFANLD